VAGQGGWRFAVARWGHGIRHGKGPQRLAVARDRGRG
jgi:hypothetical protein